MLPEIRELITDGWGPAAAAPCGYCLVHRSDAPVYRGHYACCWVATVESLRGRLDTVQRALEEQAAVVRSAREWEAEARQLRGQVITLQEALTAEVKRAERSDGQVGPA